MKKIAITSVILIAVIVAVSCFSGVFGKSATDEGVSSALCVIAQKNQMAKYGTKGETIRFSADDFEKCLNLASIASITVTDTPILSEGSLCIGDTVINAGQTISRSNLDLLNYRAADESVESSSFKFKVNGGEYEMTCKLYVLQRENSAPSVSMENDSSLKVSTHTGTMIYGRVMAYDKDGDDIRFEITSYPKNGILTIDRESGEYTYMPSGSYFGSDSFSYVAVDTYGSYSSSQKVELKIQKSKTDALYVDMGSHPAHHAALTLTEKSIMSGTTIGEETYFMPDVTVSRIDFVVMTMNAIGATGIVEVKDTGFDDDAQIPTSMKGYVRRAAEMGLITGSVDKEGRLCFEPNRPITRAEAALIIHNVVKGSVPIVKPTFADKDDIPSWASDAIYSLNHLGIMSAENGNISPSAEITRAQTAQMLYRLMEMLDTKGD